MTVAQINHYLFFGYRLEEINQVITDSFYQTMRKMNEEDPGFYSHKFSDDDEADGNEDLIAIHYGYITDESFRVYCLAKYFVRLLF